MVEIVTGVKVGKKGGEVGRIDALILVISTEQLDAEYK